MIKLLHGGCSFRKPAGIHMNPSPKHLSEGSPAGSAAANFSSRGGASRDRKGRS